MKFPKILRVENLLFLTLIACVAIGFCTYYPDIPKTVKGWVSVFSAPPPSESPPSRVIASRVLDASRTIIRAQYYFHSRNNRFAVSISELSSQEGTTIADKLLAADFDSPRETDGWEGHLFKIIPLSSQPELRSPAGFVVVAIAAKPKNTAWPLYLSAVPNADGGIIGMSSHGTWEVESPDAILKIRSLLKKTSLSESDIVNFSPKKTETTFLIKNFFLQ